MNGLCQISRTVFEIDSLNTKSTCYSQFCVLQLVLHGAQNGKIGYEPEEAYTIKFMYVWG